MSTIQEFDSEINILKALLWRHNKAENLESLLQFKQDWMDENHVQFWDDWYNDVFNLETANTFGLNVWSIILQIPITIAPETPPMDNSNWGFGEFRKNFNNGNFSNAINDIILTPEQARLALKLRYYQLTSKATVPQINFIMDKVFGHLGSVYVLDGLDMNIVYVFTFAPSSGIRLILNNYDLLPRPAGVGISYIISTEKFYGFGEFRSNFNTAPFRET